MHSKPFAHHRARARNAQDRSGEAPSGLAIAVSRAAPSARERVMYVRDIVALLNGAKSAWWMRNHFAPEHRLKIGRTLAWFEHEALGWIARQRGQR